jgi:SAM-dependent methyltransferase
MGETAYIFGRGIDDRQRLEYQFTLLRTDFDAWFDEALRLGGRSSDPAGADWSVLDLGCGEGQYSREIARRYPHATVLGADLNPAAVAAAGAATEPNARFLVHDAAEPLPPTEVPQGGFDVAVSWLVLLYLADKAGAVRNLAAALKPGGVLLLATVPDEPILVEHPSAVRLRPLGRELFERAGMTGFEDGLDRLLTDAGFQEVRTVSLTYPVGGTSREGQRWYRYFLMGIAVARHAIVDVFALIDGAEYDVHLDTLAKAPPVEPPGSVRFLVTLARLA